MQVRKRTEIRRQQIVTIIRNIISTKGIENVTIREIADRIGTTGGAIYRHFKNKRDILSLLIDDIEETLMAVIDKAITGENPIRNLNNILIAHLEYAKERRETSFIIIMGAMQFSDASIREKISLLIQKYLKRIEKMLADAIKLGLLKKEINRETSAIAFLGLIQSTVTVWSYRNYTFDPQKVSADLWNIYKHGIGA